MCEPTTIMMAAAVIGAAGTLAAGSAANAAAKQNARALEIEGKQNMDVANMQASDIRDAARRSNASIVAQQSANGLDLNAGSAPDVVAENARNYEIDALRTIYGGRVKQWGNLYEASATRAEGKNAQIGSYFQATSTLLGGAAKMNFGGGGAPPPGIGNSAGLAPKYSSNLYG